MKTLEEQVEELWSKMCEDTCIACNGTGVHYDKVSCSRCEGHGFENPEKHLKQALLTAEKRERERIREFAKNDWVFPPPDITGHLHDGRAELPAEYVRRMVLTSLLPDKRRITD